MAPGPAGPAAGRSSVAWASIATESPAKITASQNGKKPGPGPSGVWSRIPSDRRMTNAANTRQTTAVT